VNKQEFDKPFQT